MIVLLKSCEMSGRHFILQETPKPRCPTKKYPTSHVPRLSRKLSELLGFGYEVVERNIDKYMDEKRREKYLTNPRHARHHMKWSLDDQKDCNFYDFMTKLVLEFPDAKPIIARHLDFSRIQVEEVLTPLVRAVSDPVYRLSQKRLHFIIEFVFRRKELLEETLSI
jgi:hypothetical protein